MPINLLGESLFTAAMMFNQANKFCAVGSEDCFR